MQTTESCQPMSTLASRLLIKCSNLSVQFEEEVIIHNLSFSIPQGKHTVIKGASGSGKSTILKLLLGFLTPDAGEITVSEEENVQAVRARTAWLPQDLDLGDKPVREVMEKPFTFKANRDRAISQEKFENVLEQLGLSQNVWKKQFRDLSTGQRQRIGLGICYLLDKALLLLDEPTSALDRASKERVSKLLLEHTNNTIVSTSHDPYWVAQGDHIIELR